MAETKNFLDLSGVSLLWSKIKLALTNKVDKVDGKGLSTNDYTSDEKTKLANVSAGAQVNVLEGIQKNGKTVSITNKIANITVPTKTSEITNDSNFAVDSAYVHTDNNYTTAEKNKLAAVEADADVNVIETVKVNGTALTPDANKAVDVTVPTATSDLTNDGDGESPFATQAYVGTNGGKIDTISVNGTAQTITNKNVNITVPTKTSDITNDSGFITTADIPEGAAASTTVPKMDGTADVGKELAFARGDHVHPSDTTKVDKVAGKGLSTNDFTDNEKNKLDNIGASKGTGVLQGITILTIPTNDGDENANEYALVNDDGMRGVQVLLDQKAPLASPDLTGTPTAPTATAGTNTDQIATTKFVTSAVSTAIGDLAGVEFSIVTELPATGDASVIYLVSASDGSGDDVYDEYIWLTANNKFEKIGRTNIDLSDYYNTSNLIPITSAQIDQVCV